MFTHILSKRFRKTGSDGVLFCLVIFFSYFSQVACDLLRRITGILYLSKHLQGQLQGEAGRLPRLPRASTNWLSDRCLFTSDTLHCTTDRAAPSLMTLLIHSNTIDTKVKLHSFMPTVEGVGGAEITKATRSLKELGEWLVEECLYCRLKVLFGEG
jgi:hypothetical protein